MVFCATPSDRKYGSKNRGRLTRSCCPSHVTLWCRWSCHVVHVSIWLCGYWSIARRAQQPPHQVSRVKMDTGRGKCETKSRAGTKNGGELGSQRAAKVCAMRGVIFTCEKFRSTAREWFESCFSISPKLRISITVLSSYWRYSYWGTHGLGTRQYVS